MPTTIHCTVTIVAKSETWEATVISANGAITVRHAEMAPLLKLVHSAISRLDAGE